MIVDRSMCDISVTVTIRMSRRSNVCCLVYSLDLQNLNQHFFNSERRILTNLQFIIMGKVNIFGFLLGQYTII